MNYGFKWTVTENISQAAQRIQRVFNGVNRVTDRWKQNLHGTKISVAAVEENVDDLREALRRATSTRRIKALGGALRRREAELRRVELRAKMATGQLFRLGGTGSMIRSVLGGALVFGGGMMLGQVVHGAVMAQAEFGKLKAVLANTFQSTDDAERYLGIIDRFAATTPFKVTEVRESMVKLINRGVLPTQNEMLRLGEIASVTGKGLGQFVEAILDGQMAEFERFKEFGIKAGSAADKVVIRFKGMTKEIAKNSRAIYDGVLSLADAQGVKGSMEAIMKLTAGQLSNLGDQWGFLMQAIGAAIEPILQRYLPDIIVKLGEWSDWVKKEGPAFGEQIVGYTERIAELWAQYKPMVAGIMVLAGVFAALSAAVSVATTLQTIWNIAMMANPVGLVVVAVVGLIGYLGYLYLKFGSVKEAVWEFGKMLIYTNPFTLLWIALLKLMDKIPGLSGSFDKLATGIKNAFSVAWDWISDNFVGPLKGFFAWLNDVDGGVTRATPQRAAQMSDWNQNQFGFGNQKGGTRAKGLGVLAGPKEDDNTFLGGLMSKWFGQGDKSSSGSPASPTATAGGSINKLSEDLTSSRSGKSIIINIGKLVERMEFHTTNLEESSTKIREEVTRVLLDAVNESNYAI